ncbi:MAG: hypothetical protein AAGA66_06520 [Bacteroidota bacterium]
MDTATHYDFTITVGPEEDETSPKKASLDVKSWLDAHPKKTGRIWIKAGVYEESEINQNGVDIWAEDGAIVWSNETSRSILSDRHLGSNATVRVYGKGIFVHAQPNEAEDQQALNFRYPEADIEIEAKKIDMAQLWSTGLQQLKVRNCEITFRSEGANRGNSRITYENCRFVNGIRNQGYNNSFSVLTLRDTEIIVPKKLGQEGLDIYDKEGNNVLTLDNSWMPGFRLLNHTQQLIRLTGTSGSGQLTIEGSNYPLAFDTDLPTTIEAFINDHETTLKSTSDALFIKRVAGGNLSGTSGSGTFTIEGKAYEINFDTDLGTTLAKFVESHGQAIGAKKVGLKPVGDQLVFTKEDSALPVVSFAGTSGDLAFTADSHQFLIVSEQEVEFEATYASEDGDLSVRVEDYYTLQDLIDLTITDPTESNSRDGYEGISKNHFHAAGGSDGRGHNLFLDNVLIRLQKRKTIGMKLLSRVNEIDGKFGGLHVNGLTIRDETETKETIAVAQGYDAMTVSKPFKVELNGLQHDCGANMQTVVRMEDLEITSNDPAYHTGFSFDGAMTDKATPKGLINASTNPPYEPGVVGDYYYVSVDGKVGGDSGKSVQAGDKVQCIEDNEGGEEGAVGKHWIVFQGNLDKATTADVRMGTDDEKYLTPLKAFQGWENWMNNQVLAGLKTEENTIVGAINELRVNSGGISWGDPVDSTISVDTDGAYDLGTLSARFAHAYFDRSTIGRVLLSGNSAAVESGDLYLYGGNESRARGSIQLKNTNREVIISGNLGIYNWIGQDTILRAYDNNSSGNDGAVFRVEVETGHNTDEFSNLLYMRESVFSASVTDSVRSGQLQFYLENNDANYFHVLSSGTPYSAGFDDRFFISGGGNNFSWTSPMLSGAGIAIGRPRSINENADVEIYTANGQLNKPSTNQITARFKNTGTEFYNKVNLGGHQITNLKDPTDPQDAATKAYVDNKKGTSYLHIPDQATSDALLSTDATEIAFGYRNPENRISIKFQLSKLKWFPGRIINLVNLSRQIDVVTLDGEGVQLIGNGVATSAIVIMTSETMVQLIGCQSNESDLYPNWYTRVISNISEANIIGGN